MTSEITFNSQTQYEFVNEFLNSFSRSEFNVTTKARQLSARTNSLVINRLLERLAISNCSILPYYGEQQDQWYLVGGERSLLDQTLRQIVPFIIPTYAEFVGDMALAQLLPFVPNRDEVNRLGRQLYDLGYYSWVSSNDDRSTILERLNIWLDLASKQPAIPLTEEHNYRDMYSQFEQALSTSNWSEAESVLLEMQRLNLITSENLQFLRIQLLAKQQRWQDIWNHDDFSALANLRMPSKVRAAMLAAFHHTMLLPLEMVDNWQKAFAVFQESQPLLGTLLVGRFGITDAPVLRVFGYQALEEGDRNTLARLHADASDAETRKCLKALEHLLPPISDDTPLSSDPLRQVLLELHSGNYDKAIALIKSIDDIIERVLLAVEVAYHSGDDDLVKEAWAIYQRLSPEQKNSLAEDSRYVGLYLNNLRQSNLPQPRAIWPPDEAKERNAALEGIFAVEFRLRRLIEIRYSAKFGDEWVEQIKPEQREMWKIAQIKDDKTFAKYGMTQSSMLDYTYLGDLVGLINRQWSLFQDVFGKDKPAKQNFTSKTEAIIRVRNPLAHNRHVPINELRRADVYCTDLLLELENK
jgi:hypothetical protein